MDHLTLSERARDPLWLECCQLWDRLSIQERVLVVKSMRLVAQGKVFIRESLTAADTPEED